MPDNLPKIHPSKPPNRLLACSSAKAVIVSQWRNSQAIALGDESREEWLIAPEAEDLDTVR